MWKQNITDPDHMHFGVGPQKGLRGGSRISRREASTLFGETDPTFFPFLQKTPTTIKQHMISGKKLVGRVETPPRSATDGTL